MRHPRLLNRLVVLCTVAAAGLIGLLAPGILSRLTPPDVEVQGVQVTTCGLSQPTFCDTLDQPAGTGNRSGQLNGTIWGVSRTWNTVNFGQGQFNAVPATSLVGCNGTTTVRPPNDVIICNGQLREASNDNPTSSLCAPTRRP